MSALRKFTLGALILIGGGTLHGLSKASGFLDLIDTHKARGVLHDGTLYDPKFTGVAALDDFLGTLVQFFWPSLDGSAPGASLQSALFASQLIPFLIISILEANRNGNKGKLVSYGTVYALLAQAGGLALISPLYLLLYVFTSLTVTSPSPSNLAVNPAILSGIPIALALGFGVPSVILSLPTSGILSTTAKVRAVVLWQPFPAYIAVVLQMWKVLSADPSPATTSTLSQLKKLRNVYKFGLALAVPAHAATWGLSLSALFLPQIFAPKFAASFHPLAAIIPENPLTFATTPVYSMTVGSLNFLQWDYIVSSAAYLIFATNARFNTKVEPSGFSAGAAAGLVTRVAVLGPMGAALSYLWERDEIVLGREESQKKLR